jgi:hypothetical protein
VRLDVSERWGSLPKSTREVLRWAVLLLAVLLLAKAAGFLLWDAETVAGFLKSVQWAHTLPLALVVSLLMFKEKIHELIEVKLNKEGAHLRFRRDPRAVSGGLGAEKAIERATATDSEATTATTFSTKDVVEWLGKIPGMNQADLHRDAEQARYWFIRNGVRTLPQLTAIAEAEFIHSILRKLYVEELQRPEDAPLDPVAIATWGVYLYEYGPRTENVETVRELLRGTEEYKRKHGS